MHERTGFVISRSPAEQPVVISVAQLDEEEVGIVARDHEGGVQYTLGIFKRGRLHLCPVDSKVLHRLGLDCDISGRILVQQD